MVPELEQWLKEFYIGGKIYHVMRRAAMKNVSILFAPQRLCTGEFQTYPKLRNFLNFGRLEIVGIIRYVTSQHWGYSHIFDYVRRFYHQENYTQSRLSFKNLSG